MSGLGKHEAFAEVDDDDWEAANSAGCFAHFIDLQREAMAAMGATDGEEYLRRIGAYKRGYLRR